MTAEGSFRRRFGLRAACGRAFPAAALRKQFSARCLDAIEHRFGAFSRVVFREHVELDLWLGAARAHDGLVAARQAELDDVRGWKPRSRVFVVDDALDGEAGNLAWRLRAQALHDCCHRDSPLGAGIRH